MLESILDRIRTSATCFKKVGVVADVNALLHDASSRSKLNQQNLPAAFLFYAGESAAPAKDRPGRFTQLTTQRWGVMVITRSRNDASGERAKAEAFHLVRELSLALMGWTPEGAQTSMEKSRNAGSLKKWAKDLYFYSAFFQADERICKTGDE